MKALVCVAPGCLRLEDRPEPERGPGEVLLQMQRVGICGTDYHIFQGDQPFVSYPRLIGHELAGTVVEADGGSDLKPGQLVTVIPYLPCGTCSACRRGKPNCCARVQVLGVHVDGGLCERLVVPEAAVIDAEGLSPDQAAMVEFLAIGAHAVRRAALRPDMRVLVTGAGPIGTAIAIFARIAGAENITFLDMRQSRLDFVTGQLGFPAGVLAGPDADRALSVATEYEMFDCVFDATGSARAMCDGLGHVANGGTYVLVGLCEGDLVFPDPEFHRRETTLLASRNALSADFAHVIAAMRAGLVPTDLLQTHRVPLADAPRRIPELVADQQSVMKAVVTI